MHLADGRAGGAGRAARRSPWSNRYDPPLDDGAQPSADLRKTEVQANEVFDIYRELYAPSLLVARVSCRPPACCHFFVLLRCRSFYFAVPFLSFFLFFVLDAQCNGRCGG
jgi:hypothetical protein